MPFGPRNDSPSPSRTVSVLGAALPLALGLGLAMAGCAARGGPPTLVAAPGQSQEHLDAGRMLFSGHCQGCHALPEPNGLAAAVWPSKVQVMARKSGLSRDQMALVTDYLVAASRAVR